MGQKHCRNFNAAIILAICIILLKCDFGEDTSLPMQMLILFRRTSTEKVLRHSYCIDRDCLPSHNFIFDSREFSDC